MLIASLRRAGCLSRTRTLRRILLIASSILAFLVLSAPSSSGQAAGQWSGPYQWPYVIVGAAGSGVPKEISHAALIPAGPHAGKVMLFSWQKIDPQAPGTENTDTFWFFNPDAPNDLIKLTQPLNSNIFCSGTSFDAMGHLLVAGGQSIPHGYIPWLAYKLDPFKLGPIAYPTGGGVGIMGTDPTALPWRLLDYMKSGRFYPTAMALWRKSITFSNQAIPAVPDGGSNIVIGGPMQVVCDSPDWNESMEILPFRSNAFRSPLLPPTGSITHTSNFPPTLTREEYSLHPAANPPSVRFDSYPKPFQLSDGNIYLVGDTDTLSQGDAAPDHSWVLKLRNVAQQVLDFQLHKAQPDVERNCGVAWLMHFRDLSKRDRLFYAGGSRDLSVPSYTCAVQPGEQQTNGLAQSSVSELENTAGVSPENRPWSSRNAMLHARIFPNVIILPTGQVLIVGGSRVDYQRPYMSMGHCPDPVFTPELYDVGSAFNDLNQPPSVPLAPSNTLPGYSHPAPRLYHHVAVLLLDGRIFIAGGDIPDFGGGSPCVPQNWTPCEDSGEIFSPPYLFLGYRPTWEAAPPNVVQLKTQGGAAIPIPVSVRVAPGHAVTAITLLRPASVTHHVDPDQRYIELDFVGSVDATGLGTFTAYSPEENLAPPGYYMIHVNEAPTVTSLRPTWAPSVGQFVRFY